MNTESPSSHHLLNVLKTPGFLAFIITRLLGLFATQIQAIVVAWEVYDITHNAMSLAYVGLAQFVPMLLLLPFAGDFADRFNRKIILSLSLLLATICSGILATLSLQQSTIIWPYYLTLLLFGVARAFMSPAMQSLLPQIVPLNKLAQSIATTGLLMKIATLTGPILGGFLYAYWQGFSYLVCCICFTIAALALAWVPLKYANQKTKASQTSSIWLRFKEGTNFIWTSPVILGAISLDLFAVLLGGVVALLPIYANDILGVGPTGLGLLRSAMSFGEILTGVYLSYRPFNKHVGKTMFLAVGVFGLANLIFSLSTWFYLSFFALMIAGMGDMISVYIRQSLIQFSTPDYLRGRVNAVNMLFISSSNELGEFRAGSMAALLGPISAAVLGCACTLGTVGYMVKRFPSITKLNRFEDAQQPISKVN